MGIKSFLKKVGNGIKKAGRWVKNKALPFAGRLIKPVVHGISMLPGKIGMIGKLGSALTGIAESIVPKIPNENVRDKVRGWIDHEARIGHQTFERFKNGAESINDAMNDIKNRYQNEVKPLIKPIISSNTS